MKTSLDHLPEAKQQELQKISAILRDTLDGEFKIFKIILFGSHAKGGWVNDVPNGYVSDYDILVIVNSPSLVEDDMVWREAEEQIERKVKSAPLGLIVHTLQEVNEQLEKGQYFFKDIREQGNTLFDGNGKELAEPGDLTDDERRTIAQGHFEHWFKGANSFLIDFGHGMERDDFSKAAFELHQAAERFYSCLLLTLTNQLPKTHNIEKLKKYCVDLELAFADIFPLDNKFHRRSFRRLQRAYIDARYSVHYEITKDELEYLAVEVEKLKALVEKVCLARLNQ